MSFWSNISALYRKPEAAPLPVAPVVKVPLAEDFIAQFEGFRARAYMPTPDDKPTIGYGTTRYPDGSAVTMGDGPVTDAQARAWLAHDIQWARDAIKLYCKVPLSPAQSVALVSLIYNIGVPAFSRSTLLRVLNARRPDEAQAEFGKWIKQGDKVLPGLVTRRKAEAALFGRG